MIASRTMPPARTACTSDSGATDIAATWNTHAPAPMTHPIVNSGEANRALAVCTGRRMSRAGSAVLIEEADVGGQSAEKREKDAEERSQCGSWIGAGGIASRTVSALR